MTVVVVTGTGLVCPAASSVDALLAAGPEGTDPPGDWFDPVAHLGKRGWKYLTPATRYLLAAAGLVLADAKLNPQRLMPESMGVVVGTNFAANPVVSRLDEIVIAKGADWLSPAEAPNFSVNIPASHISMKYAMRAFNLTLTNPIVAGLESVLTLASAMRRGRARLGIVGATEERPNGLSVSEGACCLTLEIAADAEERGITARAMVAGGFSRFMPADADLQVIGRALDALIESVDGPLPFTLIGDDERLDEFVTARAGAKLVRCRFLGADGRYVTVSPLLQLLGLLTRHGRGLVVATSPHGHIAAIRLDE